MGLTFVISDCGVSSCLMTPIKWLWYHFHAIYLEKTLIRYYSCFSDWIDIREICDRPGVKSGYMYSNHVPTPML